MLFVLALVLWPEPFGSKLVNRLEEGKKLSTLQYAQIGLWWGFLANAVVYGLLLAGAKWWTGWASAPEGGARATGAARFPSPRLRIAAVAVLIAVALAPRLLFLDCAMRRDESDTLVRNVHGYWYTEPGRETFFRKASLEDAFWENRGANNPILFSLAARGCMGLWRMATGAEREVFNPTALRMPSLAAGVLCCLAVFWWGMIIGSPIAGWGGGLLLAIHPWHVRYSVEGRGYSMCMLFCVLSAIFLTQALRAGGWRRWWRFGIAQFLMLYSYTGSIYVAFMFFLAALVVLFKRANSAARWSGVVRLVVVCMVTGGLYVLLAAPCAPQILAYLERATAHGEMTANWGLEVLGLFSTGAGFGSYHGYPPVEFGNLYDVSRIEEHPWVILFTIALVPFFWLLGLTRVARRGRIGLLILLAILAACFVSFAHNKIGGAYLYPWYLIFALPAATLLVAFGIESVSRRITGRAVPYGILSATYVVAFVLAARAGYQQVGSPDRPVHFQRGPYEDHVESGGRVERFLKMPSKKKEKEAPNPSSQAHRGR